MTRQIWHLFLLDTSCHSMLLRYAHTLSWDYTASTSNLLYISSSSVRRQQFQGFGNNWLWYRACEVWKKKRRKKKENKEKLYQQTFSKRRGKCKKIVSGWVDGWLWTELWFKRVLCTVQKVPQKVNFVDLIGRIQTWCKGLPSTVQI